MVPESMLAIARLLAWVGVAVLALNLVLLLWRPLQSALTAALGGAQ